MNKEMLKTYGLIIGAFVVFFCAMFWFEHSNWNESKIELMQLKEDVETLKQTLNQNPMIDSLGLQKFEIKLNKLTQKVQVNDGKLRNDFYWLIKFGLPASFLALITFFIGIYKTTYKWALESAKEEIKKDLMNDSIYVKKYSKVLILHKIGTDSSKIVTLLSNHGFQEKILKVYDEKFSESLGKYDAIVFDCSIKDFQKEEVNNVFKTPEFKGVILKLKGGFVDDELKNSDRFSSATMTSQLYPNLINLLIYQKYKSEERT